MLIQRQKVKVLHKQKHLHVFQKGLLAHADCSITPHPADLLRGGQWPPSVQTGLRIELRFLAVLQWRGVSDPRLSGGSVYHSGGVRIVLRGSLRGVSDFADGVTEGILYNGCFYCITNITTGFYRYTVAMLYIIMQCYILYESTYQFIIFNWAIIYEMNII